MKAFNTSLYVDLGNKDGVFWWLRPLRRERKFFQRILFSSTGMMSLFKQPFTPSLAILTKWPSLIDIFSYQSMYSRYPVKLRSLLSAKGGEVFFKVNMRDRLLEVYIMHKPYALSTASFFSYGKSDRVWERPPNHGRRDGWSSSELGGWQPSVQRIGEGFVQRKSRRSYPLVLN